MNDWRGQTGSNKGFCVFSDLTLGYRAALVLLSNYLKRGHVSIKAIISRWAPASENDTKAYISYVSSRVSRVNHDGFSNITCDTNLLGLEPTFMYLALFSVCWYMSLFECGYTKEFYTDERAGYVELMHDCFEKAMDMISKDL